MGTFIVGDCKIVTIGVIPHMGFNGLEMILRPSGRFIIKEKDRFVALSEKKTRSITINGNIPASSPAQHFCYYDTDPIGVTFESADIFPADLLEEYKVEDVDIYGVASLLNMSMGSDPADCVCRFKGGIVDYWISHQPLVAWNYEDTAALIFSAYQTIPENGMNKETEGVTVDTTKKKLLPGFTPIKCDLNFIKSKDKLYLYSLCDIIGYQTASTAGGSVAGTASLDQRIIMGKGFLPEEVEELLSPSQ